MGQQTYQKTGICQRNSRHQDFWMVKFALTVDHFGLACQISNFTKKQGGQISNLTLYQTYTHKMLVSKMLALISKWRWTEHHPWEKENDIPILNLYFSFFHLFLDSMLVFEWTREVVGYLQYPMWAFQVAFGNLCHQICWCLGAGYWCHWPPWLKRIPGW